MKRQERYLKNGYVIESLGALSDAALVSTLELLRQPANGPVSPLSGRSLIRRGTIDSLGPVVAKYYTRGGFWGKFNSHYYLRVGPTRGEHEAALLMRAREIGVNAPEPLLWISQGTFLYRGWLITKEIQNWQSLVELARSDEDRTRHVMEEVVQQISKLIANGIFHVDLHPGNVLVGNDDKIYIVDFDKAGFLSCSRNYLRDKYLNRWRRAVIKHQLPDILAEFMSLGLRRSYE